MRSYIEGVLGRVADIGTTQPPIVVVVNEAADSGDLFAERLGQNYVELAFSDASPGSAISHSYLQRLWQLHACSQHDRRTSPCREQGVSGSAEGKGLIDGIGLQLYVDPPSGRSRRHDA